MSPRNGDRARQLAVISNGTLVGVLTQEARTARLEFEYDETWRDTDGAYPISLSMPLVQRTYGDTAIRSVLSGILPDRRATLEQIAREKHVAPDDPFALLGVLGEDCPGAMQYVRPGRVRALMRRTGGSIAWLTEEQLAARIRALGMPGAPGRLEGDEGYFSLAGQQPKSALRYDDATARWGVPEGREPTTHIVKPPIGGDLRYLVAEHVSLLLAHELALSAAESFVVQAEDQTALAVVRYDRKPGPNGWLRAHQEDVCQALGISPQLKYEKGGGPGVVDIVHLLQSYSRAPEIDAWRFLDAIALNWVIIGSDAHARNYSLLIGDGGSARLAPLYDVASVLGIAESAKLHTVNLAMQIGGNYTATKIRRAQWAQLALDLRRDPAELRARVESLVQRVPNAIAMAADQARAGGVLPTAMVDTLETGIAERAKRCLRVI